MKNRYLHLILALVPLSMLASPEPTHRSRFKDCKDCPITQTVCPPIINGNGIVVGETINTDTNAPYTFSEAVTAANASNASPCNPFAIEFAVNEVSIIEGELEPSPITKPVCINGFSAPGASESKREITLKYTDISLLFEKTACGSTVKGINFEGASNNLSANIVMRAPNSRIYGNDFTGDERSSKFGILVDRASCVTIGGLCPQERNVIQGRQTGLLVRSSNVTVVGNYIGPNQCGLRYAYPQEGVDNESNIFGLAVLGDSNVIGCKEKCGGNVISGNCINSVLVGSCNKYRNNIVGLDAWGKEPLITIPDFSLTNPFGILGINNLLGHLSIGKYNEIKKNVISGNVLRNLLVIASAFTHVKKNLLGTNICGNKSFATLTNAVVRLSSRNCIEKNLISARSLHGLALLNSSNNAVKDNVIGSDLKKSFSLGQEVGVLVSNALLPELNLAPSCLQALLSAFSTIQSAFCFSQTKNRLSDDLERSALAETLDNIRPMLEHDPAQLRRYEAALRTLRSMDPAFSYVGSARQVAEQPMYRPAYRSGKHHLKNQAQLCSPCHPAQGYNSDLPGLHESVNNVIEHNQILGNLKAGVVVSGARLTTIQENFIGTSKKCCVVPNGYGVLLKSTPLVNCTESCKPCCCCPPVIDAATKSMEATRALASDQCTNSQIGLEFFNLDGSQCNLIQKNFIAGNLFNGVAVDGVNEIPLVPFNQSFDNAILKNSIFNNCASGIRLNRNGNRCLPAPVIISAIRKGDKVEVEIDRQSLPPVPFLVELYGNTRCRAGITEGEIFLCCKTVVAPFLGPLKLVADIKCPEVKFATATVSTLGKCGVLVNTSEFACPLFIVPVPAGQEARKAEHAVVEEQERAREDLRLQSEDQLVEQSDLATEEDVAQTDTVLDRKEDADERVQTEQRDLEKVVKAAPAAAPRKKELVLPVSFHTLKLQEALRDE